MMEAVQCTDIPHFSALHFILLHRYCVLFILFFFFFYKLKDCGNPPLINSTGVIFPRAFAHFVSLCHILVILTMPQIFKLLLYLLL